MIPETQLGHLVRITSFQNTNEVYREERKIKEGVTPLQMEYFMFVLSYNIAPFFQLQKCVFLCFIIFKIYVTSLL